MSVSEGDAERIELLVDDAVVATTDSAPHIFTWDSTGHSEGSYRLKARAISEGRTFTSAPRTVIVDRTAPLLVSRTPEDGGAVAGRDLRMTLSFSEPLHPANVRPGLFAWDGLPADSAHLSEDGHALTLQAQARLELPSRYHLLAQDNGLTDLAGNRVGPIETSSVWVVPTWTASAPVLRIHAEDNNHWAPRIRAASSGTAYVALMDITAVGMGGRSRTALHVSHWDGTMWRPLGGGKINEREVFRYGSFSFVMDASGAPLVSFSQDAVDDPTAALAWVYRWQGAQWVSLGGAIHEGASEVTIGTALAMYEGTPNPTSVRSRLRSSPGRRAATKEKTAWPQWCGPSSTMW
ncbi:Ig-like domain-containing protein [Myxococcus xanthus]|uniref:Ig-like domain-containing protein n=1 Tax=Myxococcus xanthus TaxID=34 RepID=UPI001125F057|nr:Ig-like domain-containing protein [Myxococcus xanthus]